MDKQDMLDILDSLISCIRGNEQDIDTLVEIQLERMPNDELESYFRHNQATYYKHDLDAFKDDYQWEFIDFPREISGE